jgi:hypothetical protein
MLPPVINILPQEEEEQDGNMLFVLPSPAFGGFVEMFILEIILGVKAPVAAAVVVVVVVDMQGILDEE